MVLTWNPILAYARWREKYLTAHPEKRLFPWLFGLVPESPQDKEPFITLGPKGEEIKKKGIYILIAMGVLLALASQSE